MPLNGTSFATPLVSGVVALVRSRFPDLNAGQVMDLIKRTARTPGNGPNQATGYVVVDPVAALTYQLAPASGARRVDVGTPMSVPPQSNPASAQSRTIIFGVTGVCAALMAAAVALTAARRRRP
jgi:membrane-anchored mycosin MYCP